MKTLKKGFDFYAGTTRQGLFLRYKTFDQLREIIEKDLPRAPQRTSKMFRLIDQVLNYSIAQFDKNYLAFPDSGNSMAGLIGSLINKFSNQNLIAFDRSAPIATVIEIQVINWLRELIGYRTGKLSDISSLAEVGGMVTSGGHMSNHISILTALNRAFPEIKQNGLISLKKRPVILVAKKVAHYSLEVACHHLGLGLGSVIELPATKQLTTDPAAIQKLLLDLPEDVVPFMLVVTAGNPRTCSIDDIDSFAKIAKAFNLWFHVDACHGGALLFSPKLRTMLKGVELADSLSLDPHKGLFLPYPNSYVLFKDPSVMTQFSRYPTQTTDGSSWDLGMVTPFYGSRGFESLGLWLLINELGTHGLGQVLEYRHNLALELQDMISNDANFIPMHDMDFYRLAFVFIPTEVRAMIKAHKHSLISIHKNALLKIIEKYTHILNNELYKSGTVCLDEYKMHDQDNRLNLEIKDKVLVMGITVGNPLFTVKTLSNALNVMSKKSKILSPRYVKEVGKIFNATIKQSAKPRKYFTKLGPAGW